MISPRDSSGLLDNPMFQVVGAKLTEQPVCRRYQSSLVAMASAPESGVEGPAIITQQQALKAIE